MSWQTDTFATTLTAYQDHGAFGRYSGSATSERGTDAEPWAVTLRQGPVQADPTLGDEHAAVVHTRTVQSRRHAEHLLDAWCDARIAPEPLEVRA